MTTEHGEAVTSNRDTLAAALHTATGCPTAWPCSVPGVYEAKADALLPTVEAMLAQARAEALGDAAAEMPGITTLAGEVRTWLRDRAGPARRHPRDEPVAAEQAANTGEGLAEALRDSRLSWGARSDHWTDSEWQRAVASLLTAESDAARAEVVAAVESLANTFIAAGTVSVYESAREIGEMILAAVSGTDHDTTLDTVRAEAFAAGVRVARSKRPCRCGWCCQSTPPEERGETHKRTCYPRADRIAPDDTPSEPGGDDAA